MRITDIFLAFPRLILALALVAVLGPGIGNAVLAIALTAWPPYARIARAEPGVFGAFFVEVGRNPGSTGRVDRAVLQPRDRVDLFAVDQQFKVQMWP